MREIIWRTPSGTTTRRGDGACCYEIETDCGKVVLDPSFSTQVAIAILKDQIERDQLGRESIRKIEELIQGVR